MSPMVVGVSGRRGAGKDSIADALVREFGFTKFALADLVKDFAAAMTGMARGDFDDRVLKDARSCNVEYDNTFYQLAPRDILKAIGEGARGTFGGDFWIQRLQERLRDSDARRIVVSDVRRWNELTAISLAFGKRYGYYDGERDGDRWPSLIIRTNRADRQHQHKWRTGDVPHACAYPYPDHAPCGLSWASHPTHWTGDRHLTEVELPDEHVRLMPTPEERYDVTFESASGEEAAQQAVTYLRGKL